jgi:hypothetical protein
VAIVLKLGDGDLEGLDGGGERFDEGGVFGYVGIPHG